MTETMKSNEEKGTISVQMENMFPIIKKWLYSDKDIFLRELVTNAVDAINKLKHLTLTGDFKGLAEGEEYGIDIILDKEAGTLTVRDNGIGMTAEDIKKYINEVAFSGATDFIEKYKSGDETNQIIGHFGLGFYSAFMVASPVEIKTLSYEEGAQAVRWFCDGSPEYTITDLDRHDRGTEIILHITQEEKEFLDDFRVKHVLKTYCDFLPVPIRLNGEITNSTKPLWIEKPADLKESDYKEFYSYLYPFEEEPLFWIHLNVDFPVRAKGILYFPRLRHELDPNKGRIKFYYNQVYVSDNLKDLIPEFLTSLQGVIDCPDMPLNVSRSYLQSDPTMKKLSGHITKKVADELIAVYKDSRDSYIKFWDEIHPFIKFGMISNDKFFDQMKDYVLFKTTGGDYLTIKEYRDRNTSQDKIYYTSDEGAQSSYISLFKSQGVDVLIMNSLVDSHFIQFMEMRDRDIKFARVDSDISEKIVDKDAASPIVDPKTNKTANETILDVFKNALNLPKLTIKVENLKSEDLPAIIILGEHERRMKEMTMLIQRKPMESMEEHTLLVNAANPVVRNVRKMSEKLSPPLEEITLIVEQIYDLALLSQKSMTVERADRFIDDSLKIMRALSDRIVE